MAESSSPRLRTAIAAHGLARHELVRVLQDEFPGQTVVRKGRAYSIAIGRNGSPTLIVARVVHLRRAKSAPTPAAE